MLIIIFPLELSNDVFYFKRYAMSPWNGHYTVNQAIWTTAHHTQFMNPGWKYIGNGGRGMLPKGGSYVSIVNNNDTNKMIELTIVIEMSR
jgi:hypothetical protein